MSGLAGVMSAKVKTKTKKGGAKPGTGKDGRKNPKAFSVANIVRTKRTMQRNLDRSQKKEVIPQINREEELPPPALIVVMGPKGCGKSTLIRSLVKIYSGQNMADTVGPITVVAGRKRRITLFECPLDLYSMTDLAKVADLVLIMVDASYGFEMETFEFLNQLQLHGFPKVMGVMTNLDKFKANKTLQNAKKAIKHRFWTEIYKGAKMFEFMGVVNGKYRKHEVKRLSLYVSRVKFRPLVWRNTHPYLVVDRVEDVTPIVRNAGKNGKSEEVVPTSTDREVTLYGYVRGSHLKPTMKMHLIGAGDFEISAISSLPDPCPLPHNSGGANSTTKGVKVASTLKSRKDSLLYAPMANVGRVTMDRDGTYIELKNINYTKKDQLYLADQQVGLGKSYNNANAGSAGYTERSAEAQQAGLTPVEILRSMQNVKEGVDQQLKRDRKQQSLSLFAGGAESEYNPDAEDEYDVSGDEESDQDDEGSVSDSENEEDEEGSEEGENDSEDDGTTGTGSEMDEDNDEEEEDEEEGSDNEYDNEYDDQYESDSDNEGSDASASGTETEGVSDFAKLGRAAQSGAKKSTEASNGLNGASNGKGTVVRGAAGMAGGHADLMRAVYGNNWAGGINADKEKASAKVVEEESDDELFALPGSTPGVGGGQQSRKNAQYQQYLLDNSLDSSRVWNNGAADLGLVRGEHGGSVSTATGAKNDHVTLLDHLQFLERTAGGKDGKTKTSLQSSLEQHTKGGADAGPAASSEGWWEMMKQRCVTGGFANKITAGGVSASAGSDDEGFDDFEDLQTGQKFNAAGAKSATRFADAGSDSDESAVERRNMQIDAELRNINAAKKANFKASFDKKYDDKALHDEDEEHPGGKKSAKKNKKKKHGDEDSEVDSGDEDAETPEEYLTAAKKLVEEQKERNKHEFSEEGELARQQHEGYRQGLYVRILLKRVPQEFTANFRAQIPVVLGGLLPHELAMGFISARVKRHRWHRRILKSNDPLIFSIGWRRFQSIPIFTTVDQNERERYLKYTPEHMHCTATFWGPLVPPNTGILAYQKATSTNAGFRISLTGTALEQQATPKVVKKLKLVGTPTKIYKNSAFITGMFNSAMEVAKFEHAKLKTVSGIRGSIKKALRDSNHIASDGSKGSAAAKQAPGTFRATFEDKILMSDIVICRMWVPVEPKEFYNPVLSLLADSHTAEYKSPQVEELADADGEATEQKKPQVTSSTPIVPLMRTTAEIRRENKVALVVNKDSVYKPIERTKREFRKLKVPVKLQEALPFASKPKQQAPKNREGYFAKRAVILEPEEKKARAVVQMLSTVRKSKMEKRHASNEARSSKKRKAREMESARFEDQHKEEKRAKYRDEGKKKAHRPSKDKK